ncbi:zinc knuckle transcription factor [Aspergillus luchuensis]|uniref:Zinc knuckle transcription factor n=1 Tax=Aspergillus kawachii TaxID=1069201 RepID=A0A146FPJ9_ASPKA|nr:zinc knuckle transcription factor [Aspergillus luchuensis]
MAGWTLEGDGDDNGTWGGGNDAGFSNDENARPGHFSTEPGYGGDDFAPATEGHGDDNRCRNCGSDGHFARNCPEPRKDIACFNCGEDGHNKSECTKPRIFKGACRICNKEGHPAAECPEKAPDVCKNCKMEAREGHKTMDCKENRRFDLNHIPDKLPEEAWAILKKASDERDLEDFREGLKVYSKSLPQATFVDIENKLREEDLNFYLIALDKEVNDCISLIDLQGKLNCTYVVGFFYSPKPQRANLRERWPSSVEDNLERLADAGLPYDRQVPKCNNCGALGHTFRGCKEEREERERVGVKCVNCSADGHRARDCPEPRRNVFACRNCGSEDHKASECPNPRSAENVECKRCNEMGHFAKDCPQKPPPRTCRNCGSEDHVAKECDKPRDVSTVTCRNCDEVGHFSRDCPKKRDYSRVKCNNCGEMGHTIKRCPTANATEDAPHDDSHSFNAPVNDEWNENGGTQWNESGGTQQESAPAEEGEWNVGSTPGW